MFLMFCIYRTSFAAGLTHPGSPSATTPGGAQLGQTFSFSLQAFTLMINQQHPWPLHSCQVSALLPLLPAVAPRGGVMAEMVAAVMPWPSALVLAWLVGSPQPPVW